jgi:hypothetical protein
MKRLILLAIIFLNHTYAQDKVFVESEKIKGAFSAFSVDNFGRIYSVQQDVLMQFNNSNEASYSTSLKSFRPFSIESSKSFRTLVFDRDRQVIRFYDNTLTDIHGEIDLNLLGFQQPLLACESFAGNAFWVLDGGAMRLVKLNEKLEKVSQTDNLITIFQGGENPIQMLESNDYLYILIENKGVVVFDVFGTFIKLFETKATQIGTFNNYLLLLENQKIKAVKNDVFMDVAFSYMTPEGTSQFYFTNERVYFLTKNYLRIGAYK